MIILRGTTAKKRGLAVGMLSGFVATAIIVGIVFGLAWLNEPQNKPAPVAISNPQKPYHFVIFDDLRGKTLQEATVQLGYGTQLNTRGVLAAPVLVLLPRTESATSIESVPWEELTVTGGCFSDSANQLYFGVIKTSDITEKMRTISPRDWPILFVDNDLEEITGCEFKHHSATGLAV
ncbi:MAG: hypothetical protein ACRCSF_08360 [Mycobacteriaceae bacterium]